MNPRHPYVFALLLATLMAALLPLGCNPAPSEETHSVTVELMDMRGNPFADAPVFSSIANTLLDEARTDENGIASLAVADGGELTAEIGPENPFFLMVEVPEGPVVKMRSVLGPPGPEFTIEVSGAPPGEYVQASTPGYGNGGTMPSDGSPLIVSVEATYYSFQNDGRLVASASTGPNDAVTRWGAAVDLNPGQTAFITLRSTNDSPVLLVEQSNFEGCETTRSEAIYARGDVSLWPGAYSYSGTDGNVALQPWGDDLADTLVTSGTCTRAPNVHFGTIRRRPIPDTSPAIDHSPRLPEVVDVQGTHSQDGRPSLLWSSGDPDSADLITGFARWIGSDGKSRFWEFRLHPRPAGQHSIVFPPLPESITGPFGEETVFGIVQYADGNFADGYADAWKFYERPRSQSYDLQYSYGATSGAFPLPF